MPEATLAHTREGEVVNHPNNMVEWPMIECQRGHTEHSTKRVYVGVGGPTPYFDLPPIPERFTREFDMYVYSWHNYRDSQGYCPAADTVSETIDLLGVWEPAETTLVLAACTAAWIADRSAVFVDIGSQLGWFTLLAASCGLHTVAYEADAVNAETLGRSMKLNGWGDRVDIIEERIGPNTETLTGGERIAVAKIDVEGAEPDAVRMLWPLIEAGRVDNLLIEMSPCFHDGYPKLAADLIGVGYRMHMLPGKKTPPDRFERFPDDLNPGRNLDLGKLAPPVLAEMIAGWHQENVWFTLPSAPW
jgi:hypothetical protein